MASSPQAETPLADTSSSSPLSVHPPLVFPAPHQLSRGPSGHQSFPRTPSSSITAAREASSAIGIQADNDEPDSAPPRPKRVKTSKGLHTRSTALTKGQSKPIVTTYEKKALKKFSLYMYLPSRLPASIVQNKLAFANYTTSTAATYIGLWQLDSSMDVVDLRLPPVHSKNLGDDLHFHSQFLSSLLSSLAEVKSIKELYLPAVDINTFTDLGGILQPLSTTHCSIKRLVLPLTFTIQSSALSTLDYTGITKAIVATRAKEVTFVSSDNLLQQFHASLQSALTKSHKSSVKLSHSDQEMGMSGPAYPTDSAQSAPTGEQVDPHSLIDSLNTSDRMESHGDDGRRRNNRDQGKQKEVWMLNM